MALRGDATLFEVFGNNPALYNWYTKRFYGEVFDGGTVPRRIERSVCWRHNVKSSVTYRQQICFRRQ